MVRVVNTVLGAGSFGQRIGSAAVTAGGGVAGVSRRQADAATGSAIAGASPDDAGLAAAREDVAEALGSIQTSVVLTGSAGARLQLVAKIENPIALATKARNTGRF